MTPLETIAESYESGPIVQGLTTLVGPTQKDINQILEDRVGVIQNFMVDMGELLPVINDQLAVVSSRGSADAKAKASTAINKLNETRTLHTQMCGMMQDPSSAMSRLDPQVLEPALDSVLKIKAEVGCRSVWQTFQSYANQYLEQAKIVVQSTASSVNIGNWSGSEVADLEQKVATFKEVLTKLMSDGKALVEVAVQLVESSPADSNDKVSLLERLIQIRDALNRQLSNLAEVSGEKTSSLKAAVEAILMLVRNCRNYRGQAQEYSRVVANYSTVARGESSEAAQFINRTVADWDTLWDKLNAYMGTVKSRNYQVDLASKPAIEGAVAEIQRIIETIGEVSETFTHDLDIIRGSGLTEKGLEVYESLRVAVNYLIQFERKIPQFSKCLNAQLGGTVINVRKVMKSYIEAICQSASENLTGLESLLNLKFEKGVDEWYDDAKQTYSELGETFNIDPVEGFSFNFGPILDKFDEVIKDTEDLQSAVNQCAQACQAMPEGEDKDACTGACNQAKEKSQQCCNKAKAGGGCCGGCSSACASCCTNCNSAESVLAALMSIIMALLTNFITHGMKWHQGDVFIDGNVIITKNLIVGKNVTIGENLIVGKNVILNAVEGATIINGATICAKILTCASAIIGGSTYAAHTHGNGNMGSPTTPPIS